MFKNEILKKLKVEDEIFPFSVCMLSRSKLVVSGVKQLSSAAEDRIVLGLGGDSLSVVGEGMKIIEIGGGDIYISGKIGGLSFEVGK